MKAEIFSRAFIAFAVRLDFCGARLLESSKHSVPFDRPTRSFTRLPHTLCSENSRLGYLDGFYTHLVLLSTAM